MRTDIHEGEAISACIIFSEYDAIILKSTVSGTQAGQVFILSDKQEIYIKNIADSIRHSSRRALQNSRNIVFKLGNVSAIHMCGC